MACVFAKNELFLSLILAAFIALLGKHYQHGRWKRPEERNGQTAKFREG
jgi:hypothetical protein